MQRKTNGQGTGRRLIPVTNEKVSSAFDLHDTGKQKITFLLPSLRIIAQHWGLKLNRPQDFKVARRILVNSIKKN